MNTQAKIAYALAFAWWSMMTITLLTAQGDKTASVWVAYFVLCAFGGVLANVTARRLGGI